MDHRQTCRRASGEPTCEREAQKDKQEDKKAGYGGKVNRSKIEWTDYTANPVKGYCPVGCSYCYARAMYNRFGWDKAIREDVGAWHRGVDIDALTQPSKIFTGSTIELFHPLVSEEWIKRIMLVVRQYGQHTFQFLTKCPENLARWNPWPENAWVGASATCQAMFHKAISALHHVQASVRFISLEPLLGPVNLVYPFTAPEGVLEGLIIGAQTQPSKPPKPEWVERIVEVAGERGIPLFIKDNLRWPEQRREWPSSDNGRR